jgi:hypothetical protein
MQAEMMHLLARGAGGGGTSNRNRYERAYREQANVLARTERRARQENCFGGGFFLFRRQSERNCNVLLSKIREMQDNLTRLDSQRRRSGGRGNDDSYRLQELRGMMQARGCDLPGGSPSRSARGGTFLFEPDAGPSGNGTFRTLCVRTCDGYYFPISFSTTPDRFPQDEQSCQAMCPGAEARLFSYPNPGGSAENMTSIVGEPYSSLPTAFQYRTQLDPACSCHPAGYSVAAAVPGSVSIAPDPTAPPPRPRPGLSEDPETLANRLGGYEPRVPTAEAAVAIGPVVTGADDPIRVVGPALGNAEQDALVITPVPN